jgi:hypothetical protein
MAEITFIHIAAMRKMAAHSANRKMGFKRAKQIAELTGFL